MGLCEVGIQTQRRSLTVSTSVIHAKPSTPARQTPGSSGGQRLAAAAAAAAPAMECAAAAAVWPVIGADHMVACKAGGNRRTEATATASAVGQYPAGGPGVIVGHQPDKSCAASFPVGPF